MISKQIRKKLDTILEDSHEVIKKFALDAPKTLEKEPYPPELRNQIYERTFDLKHGWQVTTIERNSWEITNDAENASGKRYGKYVVGKDDQAPIHQDRWWFADNVLARKIKKVFSKAQQRMAKTWTAK